MVASVAHVGGSMEVATVDLLPSLIAELDQADDEHPDVSISDESEWTLSAFRSGLVVWENVEEDAEPRHLAGVDRQRMLELFRLLLDQDFDAIEAQPWRPGYGG